ncbi:uncharacterized protein EDB93DRAFT_1332623 [Suillus bovinus]|uniref:uncharacterized protein n=1 Tax=Suillus bovinus TaxID=48563 RepID=UPI001B872D4A|nr:uncharacterized protein EDB93DRAFT_1332623 [Suillus bovinus]KAG2127733.1 hypothetical protein EDB93DRAFT_1332623 [Suillus bovinus]
MSSGVFKGTDAASESRLRFNTNLRLLTAARGWHNPNGALLNGISAVLLVMSYSLPSLIVCLDVQIMEVGPEPEAGGDPILWLEVYYVAIAGSPLLILGVILLLQVMIAFSVSDLDMFGGPARPSKTQPSAWHAHQSIRKVVIFLWVTCCSIRWMGCTHRVSRGPLRVESHPLIQTWSFFHNENSNSITYGMPYSGPEWWIILFVNHRMLVQGPLTLGLHCSELIANVIRDEKRWRCATGRKGLQVATNPLKSLFADPICLILFIAKPFLRESFTPSILLSVLLNAILGGSQTGCLGSHSAQSTEAFTESLSDVTVVMFTSQILNLCIALLIFASFFTFIALRRPYGPQPAAYGHLQTLANLVDEWSPVMLWGHKEDGIPYCHAGTSDHPLPDVKMDCVYAGSSVPLS